MNEKVLIALIGAAAGILGAFKLPEIIKDIRDALALKNKSLLKEISVLRERNRKQRRVIQRYEQLKYKIPLIVDFVKIKNPDDIDTWKLMDMLQNDYTNSLPETEDLLTDDNNDLV